ADRLEGVDRLLAELDGRIGDRERGREGRFDVADARVDRVVELRVTLDEKRRRRLARGVGLGRALARRVAIRARLAIELAVAARRRGGTRALGAARTGAVGLRLRVDAGAR